MIKSKTKKIPIVGEVVEDKKLGNKVIYYCAECKEGCNTVYYLNGRWVCWDCYCELKNEK